MKVKPDLILILLHVEDEIINTEYSVKSQSVQPLVSRPQQEKSEQVSVFLI